ncbi:hypothetical protein HK101_003220, partial [Irineochytrium annulatum]
MAATTMTATAPANGASVTAHAERPAAGKGKPAPPPANEVWWVNGVFVAIAHAVALGTLVFYTPKWQTVVLAAVFVQLATMGITMGYHRLWSHRAFKAGPFIRLSLAFMGTLGFQGSIKWWVLRHRLHHRFTDDPVHDPYAASRGFWFSHMGWIFERPRYTRMKMVDASDLNADPVVRFQHEYFPFLAFFFGFGLPTIIGFAWGDALGSYLYAGFVSRIIIWHLTFCINSFAHWIGEQHFSTEMSARGVFLIALLTNGEGHHNFHHEFPKDYRNGLELLDWDPTKWAIYLTSLLGLTWDLYTVPPNEIAKARVLVREQAIAAERAKLDWGPPLDSLPVISRAEVRRAWEQDGRRWFILDGCAVDVGDFMGRHPGGEGLLKGFLGRDATKAFYGNLNNHSMSARTFVAMMRVARVEEGEAAGVEAELD